MTVKKTVVITGASRRLGLFLCEHFCNKNFQVLALTRTPSPELSQLSQLSQLSSTHELKIFSLQSYSEENITRAIAEISSSATKLHALIHNASAFAKDEAFSLAQYQKYFMLHMVLPAQLNEGLKDLLYDAGSPGNIVHVTDITVENPKKDHLLYCSTKAGLENLSKGFAKKYAPGIRVNSIQPGPIQFLESHSDATKKQILSETLLGHEGGFMPVFQAISSLLENPYITGSAIKVDGGRALGTG